jgi:hypothetical protein
LLVWAHYRLHCFARQKATSGPMDFMFARATRGGLAFAVFALHNDPV